MISLSRWRTRPAGSCGGARGAGAKASGASGRQTSCSLASRSTSPSSRNWRGPTDLTESSKLSSLSSSKCAVAPEGSHRYLAFISYHCDGAGSDARLLHSRLEKTLGKPVFLDTSDSDDLRRLLAEDVCGSRALPLLQTRDVLVRPWPLLELFVGVRTGKQIVPVYVEGKGYSFEDARTTMQDLAATIERRNPGGLQELEFQLQQLPEPATVEELQQALAQTLPNAISVRFDPAGTDNHLNAVVLDIIDKVCGRRGLAALTGIGPGLIKRVLSRQKSALLKGVLSSSSGSLTNPGGAP